VSNPFWLTLAPYNAPLATSMIEPIGFLMACLLISAGLAGLAVARVRPVYLHQAGRVPKAPKPAKPAKSTKAAQEDDFAAPSRPRRLWWPGPSLDTNPVLWREWHRNRPSRATRIVWGLYIGLTSLFSLKVIWDQWTNPPTGPASEIAAILNAIVTMVGLLLLSASAGTVLSEERVRGSLDVLLSTPMPTSSIVWGKWWGAFRRVPWLAAWPALVTLSCVRFSTAPWKIGMAYLVPWLIIAQGAAIASLGLALATWMPRAGRAVTWTVTALVAVTVGWPVVGMMLLGGPNGDSIPQTVVILGSPFYNIALPTILLERNVGLPRDMEVGVPIAVFFWTITYGSIALGLFLATLFSFDRCMGRTPEHPVTGRTPRREGARRIGQAAGVTGWSTVRPIAGVARVGPPLADERVVSG
jgi:ABC-type transport system involved in multi-copper enzyme maturation permease subunit